MKGLKKTNRKPDGHGARITIPSVICMLIAFSIAAPAAFAQESEPEALVAQALQANPELKSIDLQIQALGRKSESVRMWMDPVFMVEYSNFPWDSWSMGDSPMTGVQFKLQQTFTLGGKNERRQAVVQAEAKAIGWSLEEKRNQLAGLIKRTYWSLALVRQLRVITKQHVTLVGQLIEAMRAKYQVGKVGQHDLLRLEVFQGKLKDDLGEFDSKERELSAALNAAMHQGSDKHISTPDQIRLTSPDLGLDEWFELAKKKRSALKMLKSKAKAKRLAADAATFERWPDITLWAGYRIRRQAGMDDGADQMTLGLALPLPFDYTGRNEAKKAMHLSEASAMDEKELALLDEIKSGLDSALAAWERAAQKALAYSDDLIPRARKTLESTLMAYQSDRADVTSLYQAEVQLLDFERTLIVARAQAWIKKAMVETLAGENNPEKNEKGAYRE